MSFENKKIKNNAQKKQGGKCKKITKKSSVLKMD